MTAAQKASELAKQKLTNGAAVPMRVIDGDDPWKASIAKALADVQAAHGQAKAAREPLYPAETDAVALLTEEIDGARWLVSGLIEKQTTGVIAAPPKTIKSWLAQEIGLGIATGTRVCGEFYAEAGVVAMFCAEDSKQSIRNRVRALLAGANRTLQPGRLHIRARGKFIDVTKDEDLAWIVASVRALKTPITLLIIDPLRDVHSAEENSSDGMSDVMRRLRLLGELLGCAIVVCHHTTKPNESTRGRRPGQTMRGSGAIHGSLDTGIVFTDSKSNGTDEFSVGVAVEVKGRRSAGGFRLDLRVTDDENGEAVCARWKYAPLSAKPVSAAVNDEKQQHEDTMVAFVRKLAAKGQILNRTELRGHKARPIPWGKVIPTLDRLVEYRRVRLDDEGRIRVPDSVQTEISSARDSHRGEE